MRSRTALQFVRTRLAVSAQCTLLQCTPSYEELALAVDTEMADPKPTLRVLELYAGIGGMHFAFDAFMERSEESADISIRAVDINPSAKLVYDANFPRSRMHQLDIRALRDVEFEDLWLLTLSPPCQPFSRNGKVLDVADNRCESFLYFLEVLSRLSRPPEYIVMENVKGFETSEACRHLRKILDDQCYRYQEFLLSPINFGIPNARLRYYLTASRSLTKQEPLLDFLTPLSVRTPDYEAEGQVKQPIEPEVLHEQTLGQFLAHPDLPDAIDLDLLLVPLDILSKYLMVLDVKFCSSNSTNCFTSGYGRYFKGTGSVFCPLDKEKFDELVKRFSLESKEEGKRAFLAEMKLRFFHPLEVSRLMGFPNKFVIPSAISQKLAWRLLGNSLNVHVVSLLLQQLLSAQTSKLLEFSR